MTGKEFTKTVEALEEEADHGRLSNAEVIMFMDNCTVEACTSKGSSSLSPKLHGLVVWLFALMSKVGVNLKCPMHVA